VLERSLARSLLRILRGWLLGAGLRERLLDDAADAAPPFAATPPNAGPLHGNETVWRDGACVGFVRSAAFSHALRRNVAYAYVHADRLGGPVTLDALKTGAWSVRDRGASRPATVALKSPVDPANANLDASL